MAAKGEKDKNFDCEKKGFLILWDSSLNKVTKIAFFFSSVYWTSYGLVGKEIIRLGLKKNENFL